MSENNGNGFLNVRSDPKKIKNTRWIWANRIPEGGLVNMIGEEDVGKGFFACYLLAKYTRGLLKGRYLGYPINAQVVAYEDDMSEWDKRLMAANADMSKISYLQRADGTIPDLSEQATEVVRHWSKSKIRFVYIDQLLDHLGLSTDSYNTKQVRNVLMPFHSLLVQHRVTVLATMHPNKRGDTPRSRLAGSAALWQPCRSAFYLDRHPDDEDVRVLASIKANRSPQKPRSIEFQVVDSEDDFRIGGRHIKTGVVHIMTEESPITKDDLLGSGKKGTSRMEELDAKLLEILESRPTYADLRADEYFGSFSFNALKRSLVRVGGAVTPHSPNQGSRWFLSSSRVGARGRVTRRDM